MGYRVNFCYYHPDRTTVAIYSKCGVGICISCTVKRRSGKALCVRCANEELREEHNEFRKLLRERGGRFRTGKEFIVPSIIGIVLCVALTLLIFFDSQPLYMSYDSLDVIVSVVAMIFFECNIFEIPFCVRGLMDIFAPRYSTSLSILKIIIYFIVPLLASWLFLSFYLVRLFTVPRQN